ncbi:putative small GTP-binding rab protein [Trypanosoma conorhini]|uniref:Putative small GTP-binding rab protein n=1 Tax=Trypanosoma conorhini TaxID=83891 RepID=A0A3R7LGT9_9TRYP|nr:putative small GTP-binding rab protein [Trypanosoma conorhini]RNE97013.1 putative small GTP-binding rab protein [Trypanosoma conorhini]
MSAVSASGHVSKAEAETATGDASSGTESLDEQEFVFKVVVVGDYGVGKTSLVKRLLGVPYAQDGEAAAPAPAEESPAAGNPCKSVTPTVGTDFFSRVVHNVRRGQHVRLQFWDTAGLERYAAVHATTHRNASAVVVVFDVSDRRSFEGLLSTHLERAAHYNPELDQRSVVVVGNKTDLLLTSKETHGTSTAAEPVTQFDLQSKLLDLLPDVLYHEVSAVTSIGVGGLLHDLCQSLLSVHSGEESTTSPPAEGEAAKKLQHSVLPKGNSPAPAVEATPAAPPAPPADVKAPLAADAHSPKERVDGSAAQSASERHADPHHLPLSRSGELSVHTQPPFDPVSAVPVEETASPFEDHTVDGGHINSTDNDASTSPPNVPHTAVSNIRFLDPSAVRERRGSHPSLSHTEVDEGNRRKSVEYSSADSAEFQREIEGRFRRAELFARNNAAVSQESQPRQQQQQRKKASKVNLSHCCGRGGGGGGGGSSENNSKGCKC